MEHPISVREEANALACLAFRNGPIEELHAGKYSEFLEDPKLSRVTGPEIKGIMINASATLAWLLTMRENDPAEYWRRIMEANEKYCYQWDKPTVTAAPVKEGIRQRKA
jgi:hypothetical protein